MVRELSPALEKIAREQLNEKPETRHEDLRNVKDWITKQTHLKARTDDQWLLAILRGCKFSLERVKNKLDFYYTLRTTAPDMTLRLRPTDPKFLDFLKLGTILILPKSNELHPRLIFIRPGAYNPSLYSIADVMCLLYYLVQILILEDDTATVIGTKIVTDYEGITMNHIAQANPILVKKVVAVCQDSMPLRLKGSHHVNLPAGIETIITLVKGLVRPKANDRMKIHKTKEDLLEHIPKEIAPKEYGGSGGTVEEITGFWVKKVVEYKSWMAFEEKLGTDESRRMGKPKTPEDMFGVHGVQGSFRKLDLD